MHRGVGKNNNRDAFTFSSHGKASRTFFLSFPFAKSDIELYNLRVMRITSVWFPERYPLSLDVQA
jgi:hypothetical protein